MFLFPPVRQFLDGPDVYVDCDGGNLRMLMRALGMTLPDLGSTQRLMSSPSRP